MELYYCPDISNGADQLPEEEHHHCINVMRHQVGDELNIIDGKGRLYKTKILFVTKKICNFTVLSFSEHIGLRPYQLHLAIAPTKNIDRIEWLAEKATELGLDKLSFVKCRYSERKQINIERINKIVLSAAKQSISAYIPIVEDLIEFDKYITTKKEGFQRMIAVSPSVENHISRYINHPKIELLVGPEGGFSTQEIENAIAQKYQPVNLGSSRLRTETAGLYGAMMANIAVVL